MMAGKATLLLLLGVALMASDSHQASVASSSASSASSRGSLRSIHDVMSFSTHRRRLGRIPPPPPPRLGRSRVLDDETAISSNTLDQILDHFNPQEKRTWKQRYFARSDLYKDGGPAFIYIGGEGAESAASLGIGNLFMIYLADKFGAKTFDLEHRYYGGSHPTPDLSSENLQYLSADQALADLAYFIEYLIENGDIEKGQKVAVFGGSYPGNLAAWARIKYPHLVHAAVSSSAPVHAKADFNEYMEVVARSLDRVAGKWCGENIKKATDRILQLLKTDDGYQTVRDTFQIGSELKDQLDLDSFFETVSNPFAGAVQYNRDSMPTSSYNIKYICSYIKGDNLTPDQAMRKLASLVLGDMYGNGQRYDFSYKSSVSSYQSTSYDDAGAMRPWLYQTCSEFGYYQTFSGKDVPFPSAYNDLEYAYQECKDIFGEEFNRTLVDGGVKRTNLVFGDRMPDVTNVIFVNGNIDPWHALGILEDVSPEATAVLIDGGSHCADMDYPDPVYDTPDITNAHAKIEKFLQNALYTSPSGGPANV